MSDTKKFRVLLRTITGVIVLKSKWYEYNMSSISGFLRTFTTKGTLCSFIGESGSEYAIGDGAKDALIMEVEYWTPLE